MSPFGFHNGWALVFYILKGQLIMNTRKLEEPITFKKVIHRLENKELENYSKQDVFERYIVYGSEEELNNHTIQRLLIKHGYTKELIEMATDISNNIIDEI